MPRLNQDNAQRNNTSFYLKFLKVLFAAIIVAATAIALTAYATASPLVFLGYALNSAFILANLILLTWFLKNTEALVFRRVDDAFQDQAPEIEPNNEALANRLPLENQHVIEARAQAAPFFQAQRAHQNAAADVQREHEPRYQQ